MRLTPLFHNHFSEDGLLIYCLKWCTSVLSAQVLRQSFSLLLSVVLLVNAIGYYPLFKIKQWQVHEKMKTHLRTSLPNDQLQCITIAANDEYKIHWEWEWEEEQEFTYQGDRYDVVRSTTLGSTTYYYCIQDTQETQLFAQLDEEVERKMDDAKNPLQQTGKKMMKTFSSLCDKTDAHCFTREQLIAQQYFDFHHSLYQYHFLNSISPPPKYNA
ncbi:MAG: hypothetical protein JWM14_832 [Chitinophagaceae bacterium]|nr:hypothetical protein [Chitinophagaceae bacterium]